MQDAIQKMLKKYDCKNEIEYQNALKEIIQEITLLGLWRAKFFEYAAFYGGTALRILYQLDRFSEDLDFSLLQANQNFSLTPYFSFIKQELQSYGFQIAVESIDKENKSNVDSAFLKADTK